MWVINVFITLLALNKAAAAGYSRAGARITGGGAANIQQHPYIVSLDQAYGGSELHYCTGAIISNYWVLTSARCTTSEKVSSLVVRAGSANVTQGSKHEAAQIIVHPNYTSPDEPRDDIGLVKVKTPFVFSSNVQAAKLPATRTALAAGTVTTVVGWGRSKADSTSVLDYVLQEFMVPLISNADCNQGFEEGLITDGVMCANYDNTKGRVNQEDSGSPAVVSGEVVGIVSWVSDYEEYYDIYTNVSTYRSWITTQTGI